MLRAATVNPARFLKIERSSGTIAVGKRADMVLLDGNPLEDLEQLRNINALFGNGKLFTRIELNAMLADLSRHAADN